jgi:hypothetical protein
MPPIPCRIQIGAHYAAACTDANLAPKAACQVGKGLVDRLPGVGGEPRLRQHADAGGKRCQVTRHAHQDQIALAQLQQQVFLPRAEPGPDLVVARHCGAAQPCVKRGDAVRGVVQAARPCETRRVGGAMLPARRRDEAPAICRLGGTQARRSCPRVCRVAEIGGTLVGGVKLCRSSWKTSSADNRAVLRCVP